MITRKHLSESVGAMKEANKVLRQRIIKEMTLDMAIREFLFENIP